jgi:ABC-type Na+ efflux pump permease subunit
MNTLNITWKDLLLFAKDLGRLFMTFLLPLVFIMAFGFAYSQLSGGVQLVQLAVVNLDGGEMSQVLIDSLNPSRGVKVTLYEQAEADRMLEEEELQRVLMIPAGFTQAVQADGPDDGGQPGRGNRFLRRRGGEAGAESVRALPDRAAGRR